MTAVSMYERALNHLDECPTKDAFYDVCLPLFEWARTGAHNMELHHCYLQKLEIKAEANLHIPFINLLIERQKRARSEGDFRIKAVPLKRRHSI